MKPVAQIVSRIIAVLLVAVVLALILRELAAYDLEQLNTLSHKELVDYFKEGCDTSFGGNYLYVAVVTVIYTLVVEGLAYVLRLGWQGIANKAPV